MPTKATLTRKRNSKIYTELAIMIERLTGKAPNVHTEGYQRLMKQVRKYVTPLLVEQENMKGQK